jgi:hypothetical protein
MKYFDIVLGVLAGGLSYLSFTGDFEITHLQGGIFLAAICLHQFSDAIDGFMGK